MWLALPGPLSLRARLKRAILRIVLGKYLVTVPTHCVVPLCKFFVLYTNATEKLPEDNRIMFFRAWVHEYMG